MKLIQGKICKCIGCSHRCIVRIVERSPYYKNNAFRILVVKGFTRINFFPPTLPAEWNCTPFEEFLKEMTIEDWLEI